MAFDIVPAVVEFEVNQGSVVIEEPFQVAGFSVYGKVVNKKGVRLSVCLSLCLLAYLHCRIQTRIQSPNPMATLSCTKVFTLQSDSDSSPNC